MGSVAVAPITPEISRPQKPHERVVGISLDRKRTLRLNADAVVYGSADPLFTAEESLCSLNRHVSEKELDLLQFATAGVTELRARAAVQ